MNVSAEVPPEPPVETITWVEGNDTYFEITNSDYLNVTLMSSEDISVYLESIPNVVSFNIEANCSADSTQITLSGFEANKTYFMRQDVDFQGAVEFI